MAVAVVLAREVAPPAAVEERVDLVARGAMLATGFCARRGLVSKCSSCIFDPIQESHWGCRCEGCRRVVGEWQWLLQKRSLTSEWRLCECCLFTQQFPVRA